jgi:hypothetical protein
MKQNDAEKISFEIIDVFVTSERKEKIFAVRTLKGNATRLKGTLHCLGIAGRWQATSILFGNPATSDIALTLSGPDGLVVGMQLVED